MPRIRATRPRSTPSVPLVTARSGWRSRRQAWTSALHVEDPDEDALISVAAELVEGLTAIVSTVASAMTSKPRDAIPAVDRTDLTERDGPDVLEVDRVSLSVGPRRWAERSCLPPHPVVVRARVRVSHPPRAAREPDVTDQFGTSPAASHSIALQPVAGLVASVGLCRGAGTAVLTIDIAQVLAVLGLGAAFALAVPGLRAAGTGSAAAAPPARIALSSRSWGGDDAGVADAWWRRADQPAGDRTDGQHRESKRRTAPPGCRPARVRQGRARAPGGRTPPSPRRSARSSRSPSRSA